MDNYTKITKGALKYLAYIIASCIPLCGTKHVKNEEYILRLAQSGKDTIFRKFVQELPEPSELYRQIYDFTKEQNEIYTDVKTICRFFAGRRHIEKVVGDIVKAGLNEPGKKGLKMFFIFAHTLIPLTIDKVESKRYSGTYENGPIAVRVNNLMTFNGIRDRVQVGKTVFSHYASIICVPSGRFTSKIIREILDEQARNEEFLEAAEYLSEKGEIDFNKFPQFRDAAEKVANKYNL